MNKIAVFIIIALIGTAALAAPKKPPVKSVPTEVIISKVVVNPGTPSSALIGKTAIGVSLGYPTVKYHFSNEVAGSLGLMYGSAAASCLELLVKVDYNLAKRGEVQPCLSLYYTTNGAPVPTTVIGITGGASVMLQPNFSMGVDVALLSSTAIAGASTTGILGRGFAGALAGVSLTASFYL